MHLLRQLGRLLQDPPPEYAFEVSPKGIAWGRRQPAETGFRPLEPDVLSVSPIHDNVQRAEELLAQVRAIVPPNGTRKRRKAALILPDYCARVSVLDFDAFPSDPRERLSLVRFRVKKSVPFDVDSAAVSYYAQPAAGDGKKFDVVAVVAALEIVARYEAAFRGANLHPGFVTTSTLASLDLLPVNGLKVFAKLCDQVLTVSVVAGTALKLLRCVELDAVTTAEVMSVIYPTVAYVEDELYAKPDLLSLCGFGAMEEEIRTQCASELGVVVERLRGSAGAAAAYNAGLLGYLESVRE